MSSRKAAAASARRRVKKTTVKLPRYNETLRTMCNKMELNSKNPKRPQETKTEFISPRVPSIIFADKALIITPEISEPELNGENIEKFQIEVKKLFAWTEYDESSQTRFIFLIKLPEKLFYKGKKINGWQNGYEKMIGGREKWVPFYISSGKNSSNTGDGINRTGHTHPLYGFLRIARSNSLLGSTLNKFINEKHLVQNKKNKILPDKFMDEWMVKCGAIGFFIKRILLQMFRQKKTHTTKSKEVLERLENAHNNWDLWPLPQLSNADLEMLYTLMEKTAISISGGEEEYN